MGHLSYLQAVLLGLCALIVAFAGFARRFKISYPIVLVIVGLLCSLLPRLPRVPLAPDVVFLVFLPPLLFSAAWQTSWREFRYNLVSIAFLAVGLVFFTALGVALTAHFFMPGFDWRLGFLLGAIVSPTDAVAATSIARNVGMPHGIVDLLEGESLVNDATGLLALQFGVEMILQGTSPHLGKSLLEFVWLLAGGIGVGLVVGAVVVWADRWVDDGPVEIVLSFLVAYGSYLAGEEVRASGVIATVTCGLYMSRRSSSFFSPSVRLQAEGVWNAAEFLLNGLVFVLIGLQLPYVLAGIQGYSRGRLVLYGLAFSAVLVALRLLWVFPAAPLARYVRHRFLGQNFVRPGPKSVFVLGWTGMRGVVALAAASSLPYTIREGTPFPQRNMILFLTFAVILVTLVLQGLTLPAVVRGLGLAQDSGPACEEDEARRLLLRSAIGYLEELDHSTKLPPGDAHPIRDLLGRFQYRLDELQTGNAAEDASEQARERLNTRTLLLETYRTQRDELNNLRSTDRIGDAVYRTLERELDLGESRLLSQK